MSLQEHQHVPSQSGEFLPAHVAASGLAQSEAEIGAAKFPKGKRDAGFDVKSTSAANLACSATEILAVTASPSFAGLPPSELALVAKLVEPITVEMGQTVVRQGDAGSKLYFIESGHLEVAVQTSSGKRAVLARLGPGDYFGEIAFLGGGERTSDVVALGPGRLWMMAKEKFLPSVGSLTAFFQRLTREALQRNASLERHTTLVEQGMQDAAQAVLEKIMHAEVRELRVADRKAQVGFEEITEFYTRARFLYPAKLEELAPRMAQVRETWESVLRANNSIFKIFCGRKLIDGQAAMTNSICAYQYSPTCWQIQHLVSADRLSFTGTLLMLMAVTDWFRRSGYGGFHRFTYRPDNAGVTQLFAHVGEQLGKTKFHSGVANYWFASIQEVERNLAAAHDGDLISVVVETALPADARDLYASQLHPVEYRALDLENFAMPELEHAYSAQGLEKTRFLLVARDQSNQLLGVAIANVASPGMNFSFLENALEYFWASSAESVG